MLSSISKYLLIDETFAYQYATKDENFTFLIKVLLKNFFSFFRLYYYKFDTLPKRHFLTSFPCLRESVNI